MAKKTPMKKLHEKAWRTVGRLIKLRDNNLCQHCGQPAAKQNGHVSHVIPKSCGGALRYDPRNLKLLCYHCHINWWHKNPAESGEWFRKTFPDRWEYLETAPRLRQYRTWDLEELIAELEDEIERLENEK